MDNSETNRAMSVNDAGHDYELHNVGEGVQNIRFIKKDEIGTVHDGTTTEAVLQVLIHRLEVLDEMPSEHDQKAIASLKEAYAQLEARTADRKERGVEGTQEA